MTQWIYVHFTVCFIISTKSDIKYIFIETSYSLKLNVSIYICFAALSLLHGINIMPD